MLNVTMLQTPSVTLDGVPVSFPFKRADALLYYMLVRRSATRQELISLLWESCDEATGLKNLRNTLYTLKKTLGGDFLLSPQKSLVVVNSAWEVDCDYDRFTQQGDFSAYRGPFLQGFAVKHAFSFDEWLDRTREKLHAQYLGRLAQQAQAALEGGDPEEAEHPERLPAAKYQEEVLSDREGYVSDILTEEIGRTSLLLGGGRETKESESDLAVGVVLLRKKGEYIRKGEPLAVIHANSRDKVKEAEKRLLEAYTVAEEKPVPEPLIKEVI